MIDENLKLLLDEYEKSITWHQQAIKRHNAEIARLNRAFSDALHSANIGLADRRAMKSAYASNR